MTVINDTMIIQLPFSGFYESRWSGEIDHVEEQECECMVERQKEYEDIPKHLQLDASDFADLLMRHATYRDAYEAIAKRYVAEFDDQMADRADMRLGLTFESMRSPKYYNFEPDRLFAHIPVASVEKLFAVSASDGHKMLQAVLADRHKSRSGFHSYYSHDLDTWLAKPLADWDHNELCSLLLAAMGVLGVDDDRKHGDDLDWAIYYSMADGDSEFYDAWSDCVDWKAFEAAVAELRAEKLEEWQAEHPDLVPPVQRCDKTGELPLGN